MARKRISRRRFIAGTAATAAAISAPHVSTSYAAGKLSLGIVLAVPTTLFAALAIEVIVIAIVGGP